METIIFILQTYQVYARSHNGVVILRCQSEGEKNLIQWTIFLFFLYTFLAHFTFSIIKMIFPPSLLMRLNHEMSVTDNALGSIREMWEERDGFCSENIYITIEYI